MGQEMAPGPAGPGHMSQPLYAVDARVRSVMEASPTALILVDHVGRVELVNARAERMFGHVALRSAFLAESSARQMGVGRALFGRRKDGSEFPLEIGLNPLMLDNMPMVLAGVIDMTAPRAAERERAQRERALQRSNADLEEFAYVASHDLKAPLRAVGLLADWISEDVQAIAPAETLENLRLLKGRVSRLQSLLDGLLTYARVGLGNLPPEQVDAGEMVTDIAALLGAAPHFSVTFEGPLQILHTHRTPLHAVLENLISNALKHHDRPAGRVCVGMRRVDGLVEFTVADDGPGIAPRFHERVFQIFQTLGRSDESAAGGIGLAIVKKQVGRHGGTVHIRSEPPLRGTTFIFTWQETPT